MNDYSWNDLRIGLSATFSVRVTQGVLEQFTDITGDINPLHTDESYAKALGYSGKLVHGLLTASFYSTLVGIYLPGKRCLLHSVHAKFVSPVYVGDALSVKGQVVHLNDAYRQASIAAVISSDEANRVVSTATILVGVS